MGGKKKKSICRECSKAKFPAISAAKLGHESCLVTAYRVLGVFNERDSYGATPIHYSARNGQLDCLKWLVAHSGISPVVAAKNGTTAAHDAAAMGHLLCLQFLLEGTKCSPQDRTNEGATVLHMACRFGHVGVTRWLIEKKLSSPREKGDNGVTPVHLCAAKNHLECMKHLTHSPMYLPNELTVHGATPIYFAAQEGSLECLQWLLTYGEADPSIFANDGMGPLHAAAQAGEIKCLKWLVKHGGVSATQKAEDGATPMHFAAAGGQILCLEWLVDNGGSLMDRDDLGGTPLHDAAEQGQTEVVSFILGCGIQKDITDNEGYTPIDLAKDNNHIDCMKLFYIKTPNLLNAITPQQPQNRASTIDEEVTRREKQKKFEKALLSKTTEKEREEIWKNAKENVPASNLLTVPKPDPSGAADSASNNGSRRSRARSSLDAHRLSLSLINDLVDDHAGKDRPALRPDLFSNPDEQDIDSNKEKNKDEKKNVSEETQVKVESIVVIAETVDQDQKKTRGNEERHNDDSTTATTRHELGTKLDFQEDSSDDHSEGEDLMKEDKDPMEEGGVYVAAANKGFNLGPHGGSISKGGGGFKDTSEDSPYEEVHSENGHKRHPVVTEPSIHVSKGGSPGNPSNSKEPNGKPSRWKGLISRLSLKKSKKSPSTNDDSRTTTVATTTKNSSKKNNPTSASVSDGSKVVLRSPKPSHSKSADFVFTHRTSKVEEFAYVTHKRLSTDDEEVAVQFENRPLAARQSTLSAIDNMSSPESSADEMEQDAIDDDTDDIFRPITKMGFDRFGKPIYKERDDVKTTGEHCRSIDYDDSALLEERGSLASLDTMIIHEEDDDLTTTTSSLKEPSEVRLTAGHHMKQLPYSSNASKPPNSSLPHHPPLLTNTAEEKHKRIFNEPIVKSSPSPRRTRRPMLVASIEEEDEEDLGKEERGHSLTPLPTIHVTHSRDTAAEDCSRINGGSPEVSRGRVRTDNVANQQVSSAIPTITSQGRSSSGLSKNSGVRSFALIKQKYESSSSSQAAVNPVGFPRGAMQNKRNTSVYSPLMVVATASPRVSLTSVAEDEEPGGEEKRQQESTTTTTGKEQQLLLPDSQDEKPEPEEKRVSFTPSQEAAFENLEKLKDSLNNLPTEIKNEGTVTAADNAVLPDHKEAMRTSPAVEELFDMIKDLDDMIKSKNNADSSSSENLSLSSHEIQSLVSTPQQIGKNDSHVKTKPEITVSVDIDGIGTVQVAMKRDSLVISLMFKAAESAGITLTANHAMFEVHTQLKIERPLEDHERIAEIVSRWPKKNPPHFHLHSYHEKYLLWEDNPLPKGYVGQFLKQGKIPNISSSLQYYKGGITTGKGKWSSGTHCLGSLGIYAICTSKVSSNMDLVCATDQMLFFPIVNGVGGREWGKFKPLPTKHCFVMKPASSWKEKDLKVFCCEDYQALMQWVSGIRLVKYGLQLKCNYVAMTKRLDQLTDKNSHSKAVKTIQ